MPLLCTLAATPAVAFARSPRGGSGGSGLSGSGGASTTAAAPTTAPATTSTPDPLAPNVVKLGGVVNASGDGITFTVAASGILGQPLRITGAVPTSDAGAQIDIQSAKPGHSDWIQVATSAIAADGSFSAQWTPATSAQVELRAVLAPAGTASTPGGSTNGGSGLSSGSDDASAAADELTTSALTIPIFKDATATIYGPGLWGHHTACGQRLTRTMLGVASRTLKCGTDVSVFYRGREMTVPVIDRGPFANHASWDLTMATAKDLGIKQTVTIGTLNSAPAVMAAVRR